MKQATPPPLSQISKSQMKLLLTHKHSASMQLLICVMPHKIRR